MADTKSKMPFFPRQPLLSLLKPSALEKLIEENPNSHFPRWEGRSENKIFSDITTHLFSLTGVYDKRQIKGTGVEISRTVDFWRGNLGSFFRLLGVTGIGICFLIVHTI